MEDQPTLKEELSSELTGLNKGEKAQKKKLIIGLSIGIGILVIIAVIIIIVAVSGKDDGETEDDFPKDQIGEINLKYDVQTITENTILFGGEFQKGSSDFDVYIDGKQIKYSRYYKFSSLGEHEVHLVLYRNLNMDYMFKDTQDLLSIEMISDNKCKITSMVSTFENCQNLHFFN